MRIYPSALVKIYGSGGLKGLEAYQSGFLISADGYILTVWSYVLDDDEVICMLHDGQKLNAKLKGYDPQTEVALLKIPATNLEYFPSSDYEKLFEPRPNNSKMFTLPPYSPELNPDELVWNVIMRKAPGRTMVENKDAVRYANCSVLPRR